VDVVDAVSPSASVLGSGPAFAGDIDVGTILTSTFPIYMQISNAGRQSVLNIYTTSNSTCLIRISEYNIE
jgi:hypothetical protein